MGEPLFIFRGMEHVLFFANVKSFFFFFHVYCFFNFFADTFVMGRPGRINTQRHLVEAENAISNCENYGTYQEMKVFLLTELYTKSVCGTGVRSA